MKEAPLTGCAATAARISLYDALPADVSRDVAVQQRRRNGGVRLFAKVDNPAQVQALPVLHIKTCWYINYYPPKMPVYRSKDKEYQTRCTTSCTRCTPGRAQSPKARRSAAMACTRVKLRRQHSTTRRVGALCPSSSARSGT